MSETMRVPPCGNYECRVSTSIADTITAGVGGPDANGFFNEPCAICEDFYARVLDGRASNQVNTREG